MPLFERFHWSMADVEALEFDEFTLISDAVKEINKREQAPRK